MIREKLQVQVRTPAFYVSCESRGRWELFVNIRDEFTSHGPEPHRRGNELFPAKVQRFRGQSALRTLATPREGVVKLSRSKLYVGRCVITVTAVLRNEMALSTL